MPSRTHAAACLPHAQRGLGRDGHAAKHRQARRRGLPQHLHGGAGHAGGQQRRCQLIRQLRRLQSVPCHVVSQYERRRLRLCHTACVHCHYISGGLQIDGPESRGSKPLLWVAAVHNMATGIDVDADGGDGDDTFERRGMAHGMPTATRTRPRSMHGYTRPVLGSQRTSAPAPARLPYRWPCGGAPCAARWRPPRTAPARSAPPPAAAARTAPRSLARSLQQRQSPCRAHMSATARA